MTRGPVEEPERMDGVERGEWKVGRNLEKSRGPDACVGASVDSQVSWGPSTSG